MKVPIETILEIPVGTQIQKILRMFFVLEDSMVKHVYGWDITERTDNKRKVYMRHFSRSMVDCIKDYMKPCIRENHSDDLKFHVRTKDVPSNKKAKCIAKSNVSLAKELKESKLAVSISSIIPRNDNWNYKVMKVNNYSKHSYRVNDIRDKIRWIILFSAVQH